MDYDSFIGLVQRRARLPSREAAVAATRATLETLGERIAGGELKDVASQLPREIAYYLTRANSMQKLSLQDFYHRVGAREPSDPPTAKFHTRAVLSVLNTAISPGEMSDLRAQMPGDYDELFDDRDLRQESPAASSPARDQL